MLIQSLCERDSQHTICLVHEHAEIIDLMAVGRANAAVAAMQHHLDYVEQSLNTSEPIRLTHVIARPPLLTQSWALGL